MHWCFDCTYVCAPCVCLVPEELRIRVTDRFEPPRRCWELNPGPLQEQLLTTKPSLQLQEKPLWRFSFWSLPSTTCLEPAAKGGGLQLTSPDQTQGSAAPPHSECCEGTWVWDNGIWIHVPALGLVSPMLYFTNDCRDTLMTKACLTLNSPEHRR